ncbi:MAG: PRC-barrel domain-containing protein, partial [Woeseiaceae bacterium]
DLVDLSQADCSQELFSPVIPTERAKNLHDAATHAGSKRARSVSTLGQRLPTHRWHTYCSGDFVRSGDFHYFASIRSDEEQGRPASTAIPSSFLIVRVSGVRIMKRILSATMLLAAIVAGYSSGAAAQQASDSEIRHLHERNQERPVAENDRNEEKETRASHQPQNERPQPQGADAMQSESHGSGLAPRPYKVTMMVRIEQVPRRVAAEEASRLVGKSAVSRRGEEVGEISAVVRSPSNGLHAVVDVGEFFGIGVRPVALPIEPGGIDRNGNLRVQLSREDLKSMQRYDPEMYR